MNRDGLNKIFWGFLFIMLDFKIQGFDILPDIIGYILFALGFSALAAGSEYFKKAGKFNILLIIFSIFSIYEKPAQSTGVHIDTLGVFGILVGIVVIVLNLLVMYNLFMGVGELASRQGRHDLSEESEKKWKQYLALQIATMFSFLLIFIPFLAVIFVLALVIISLVLMVSIILFIKRCSESL